MFNQVYNFSLFNIQYFVNSRYIKNAEMISQFLSFRLPREITNSLIYWTTFWYLQVFINPSKW